MPEKARYVIDVKHILNEKPLHSKFYDRLADVTDRISIYRDNFCTNKPIFEKIYFDRKNISVLDKVVEKVSKEHGITKRLHPHNVYKHVTF